MDVEIRCLCPDKDGQPRHEHDTVTLADTLDFRRMLTIRQTVRLEQTPDLASMTAVLAEAYLLNCIDAWSLVDEAGKPVPVTRETVASLLLTQWDEAEAVGNAADALYTERVILPLLNWASPSSTDTPTPKANSTSPTNGHGTRRPKPSKPSSISTTPTVSTGPMAASPGGGSSSFQS